MGRFALCALIVLSSFAAAKAEKKNVLFIAVDDLRPELGCYGARHVKSPNIDQFAQTALRFERAYCQQAVCNPSRTSLMTGLRPDTIGVTGNHSHFRSNIPGVVTLPQHFKNHGYYSAAIGKLYHGVFPDGCSNTKWDTMGDPKSWSVPAIRFGPRYYYTEDGIAAAKEIYQKVYKPKNPGPDDWTQKLVFGPATESPDVPDSTLYDGQVADEAVKTLAELKDRDEPFFLAVGFIKPHSPYIAPRKYFDLYDDVALASETDFPTNAPSFAGHGSGELRRYTDQPKKGAFSNENQRRVRHAYFACVSYIDAQIGRVLDELDRLGLTENTIVSLYGDHGYHLGEQGLWGKTTNFELDTRVPLLIRAPGMKAAGKASSSLVELVDLYPTLADLAGLPIGEQLEGKSLVGLLDDPSATVKDVAISQYPRGRGLMGYSMRTPTHRLTHWVKRDSGGVQSTELYSYGHGEVVESKNIAAEQPALVKKLSQRLVAFSSAANTERVDDEGSQARMTIRRAKIADIHSRPANQKTKNPALATVVSMRRPSVPPKTVSLARPFGDHMVLQAEQPIRIWGLAEPRADVKVALGSTGESGKADASGRWMVELPKQSVNAKPQTLVVASDGVTVRAEDVLIGEVWLCAGQSNMEWPLSKATSASEVVPHSGDPLLRLHNCPGGARGSSGTYSQKHTDRLVPENYSNGEWKVAGPESSAGFSAVGYFFAQRLRKELGVPIGVINVSVGGTPIESWVSKSRLMTNPKLAKMFDGNWLENPVLDDWCKERARSNLKRGLANEFEIPGDEYGPNHSFKPGFMHEAGIRPFTPLSIRGGLWYQGESNGDNPDRTKLYDACFLLLVDDWRASFRNKKMPIAFVQLPAMGRPNWPVFREYQRRSLARLNDVGMAITIDTGDPRNVHPGQKQPVGFRLAQWALVKTYGRSGPAMGPLYLSKATQPGSLVLTFDTAGDKLATSDGAAPNNFEIADADGVFQPAVAEVSGNQVILRSSEVPRPVHARYAWAAFPDPRPNLGNSIGLPASPFTTEEEF